jgi:hypothetical protein
MKHMQALGDPYFPVTSLFDTGDVTAKFKAPFYSTPEIYCGKPQIRIATAWRHTTNTHNWIQLSINAAAFATSDGYTETQNIELWTEQFMRTYIGLREGFALALTANT